MAPRTFISNSTQAGTMCLSILIFDKCEQDYYSLRGNSVSLIKSIDWNSVDQLKSCPINWSRFSVILFSRKCLLEAYNFFSLSSCLSSFDLSALSLLVVGQSFLLAAPYLCYFFVTYCWISNGEIGFSPCSAWLMSPISFRTHSRKIKSKAQSEDFEVITIVFVVSLSSQTNCPLYSLPLIPHLLHLSRNASSKTAFFLTMKYVPNLGNFWKSSQVTGRDIAFRKRFIASLLKVSQINM